MNDELANRRPTGSTTGQEPVGSDDPFDELDPLEPRPSGLPVWLQGMGAWTNGRPVWATVVGAILFLNALSQVLYAGMIPLLPPILPDPVPWFGFVVGALSLAASLGIYRGLEWGRWLGMALAATWLARSLAFLQAWMVAPYAPSGPSLGLEVLLPIAINGLVLLLLLLRWPRRPADT